MQNAKKIHMQTPFFVLRNVFPVEWGIFAFSSIIIVTKYNSQKRLWKPDVLWGGDDCRPCRLPPFLEPWRVEVALLVEGAPRH
jgi:hypothetical protein